MRWASSWADLCAALLLLLAYREVLLWIPRASGLPQVVGWFFQSSATSPQLIYAVAALLLASRGSALRNAATSSRPAPWLAATLLLPGVALFLWGVFIDAVQPLALSLPLVLAGLSMLRFGPGVTRAAALPLLLLFFAVPLPPPLSHAIVHPLQLATGATATMLLRLGGVSAILEGDVIFVADRTFDVLETCGGLRSIETLTQLAIVYTAFFRVRLVHGMLLVAVAPVIGFTFNALRVLFIILYPEAQSNEDHAVQGVVMFVAGAAALRAVDALLLRVWPLPESEGTRGPSGRPSGPRRIAAGVALAAGLVIASVALPQRPPPERGAHTALTLPTEVEGWSATPSEWDPFYLGSVRFTRAGTYRYSRGDQQVEVFLASDDRLRRSESFLSPKNALPGRGWQVLDTWKLHLEPGGQPMVATLAQSGSRELLTYHGYRNVEGVAIETLRSLLALDRSPFRRGREGRVVRMATPLPQGAEGRAAADERLRALYVALEPMLWEPSPGPGGR